MNSTKLTQISETNGFNYEELVSVLNDEVITSSKILAERFNKRHDDVLKAIRNLECSDNFRLRNFAESSYLNEQNKLQPEFKISQDGFMFLAMGFTGKEAAKTKEQFIYSFNRMREALNGPYAYT